MTNVRVAAQNDKNSFYRLWKVCFGDSDAFCSWFFDQRFVPSYSIVLEANNSIASCMQAFPYAIHLRGKDVPGAMLCGVSTHPNERGKGHMGKIFSYEMNHLRKKGCLVAPHTPAVLPSYFSFGHYPVADAKYLECDCVPALDYKEDLIPIGADGIQHLYPLYKRFAMKYSGIVQRTEDDFMLKAADYAADGGKCAAYMRNNEIKGYVFYYQTEEALLCVEAVAEEGFYHYLMKGLLKQANGLKFSAKLPPELYLGFSFMNQIRRQKGVMGLCNASALLNALELDIPYCIKVKDHIVPENNGIFDFKGNLCEDEPAFEISAGHLLQVLVGYYTLKELKNEITVCHEAEFDQINADLPRQHCYIIDEY